MNLKYSRNHLLVLAATLSAPLVVFSVPSHAVTFGNVPIEEEFAAAQWSYVDSSLGLILVSLANEGFIDTQAVLSYNGEFDIYQDAPESFSGKIVGALRGVYAGEPLSIDYEASVITSPVLAVADVKNMLEFTFSSSGFFNNLPNSKKYTDSGTFSELDNNTGELTTKVTINDGNELSATVKKLVKTKVTGFDGFLELDGTFEPGSCLNTLYLKYDQQTKSGTSQLGVDPKCVSGASVSVYSIYNKCKLKVIPKPQTSFADPILQGFTECDFGLASVPGPLPLLGVGAAFGYSRKLRKHIKTSRLPVASAIH